jgi:HK97 family phage major capsid protein
MEFVKKTAEEMAEMSAKELAEYHSAEMDHNYAKLTKSISEKASKTEIDSIKAEIQEAAKKENEAVEARVKEISEKNVELETALKAQGERIKSVKQEAAEIDFKNPIKNSIAKSIAALLSSDEFAKMQGNDFKGATKAYGEKAVVDITTDHTGTVLLSDIRDRVRYDEDTVMPHMYDFIPRDTTDGNQIVFPQFYSLTDALVGASAMYGENGEITDVEFKTKEVIATIKRIGQGLLLSKRYIKTNGLRWVQSYILNRLPNLMLTKLDFQMLFGSGSGDELDGLTGSAQSFDLTPNTYTATAFSSVEDYADGLVKVTFAAAHNIKNGDNLTIADSTNYNDTYNSVIVISETEVLIEATYVTEADTSAWTGSSTNSWYLSVDGANSYDVAIAAVSIMKSRGFNPTAIIVNPNELGQMSLTKSTQEEYLDIIRDAANNLRIKGLPVIELQAMPAGKMLIGNFNEVAISEYTPLQISASESTSEKRKNQVAFIGEMELIFPIYNPYAFMYVDVSSAKTELETA